MSGILKCGGRVQTKVVINTKTETLMLLIISKVESDSVFYTNCYRSYNALNVSDFYHERINHSKLFDEARIRCMALRIDGIKPGVC